MEINDVQTINVSFPVTILASEDEEQELGMELNLSTGEYLGLVFTDKDSAHRYMYTRGIEARTGLLDESKFVQMCRRLEDDGMVKTLLINPTSVGRECKAISVREIAMRRIPEDKTEAERRTGYDG